MHDYTCGDGRFDRFGGVLRYWVWLRRGWSIDSVFKEAGIKWINGSIRIMYETFLCVDEDLFLSERVLALPSYPCPGSNETLSSVRNRVVITCTNFEQSTRVQRRRRCQECLPSEFGFEVQWGDHRGCNRRHAGLVCPRRRQTDRSIEWP